MSRRRDAVFTVVVAIPLALAVVVRGTPIRPESVLYGALGTIVLELVLLSNRERVQTAWRRPSVQLSVVVGGALLVMVGVALVDPQILVVVLSGLVTYLCLLAAVSIRDYRRES
ncbi:hypothetical protein [Haloferax sp. DFSO60]|uniref:hypothetical protein n=1 Tax=Haloferax sp. DFSO60 TaxID=3388652 RepID=UPI0039789306